MSFSDLTSYDQPLFGGVLIAFLVVGIVSLILGGAFFYKSARKAKDVVLALFCLGTFLTALIVAFDTGVSSRLSLLEFVKETNAKKLEDFALSEYGVSLTVTDVLAMPSKSHDYSFYNDVGGRVDFPNDGFVVATTKVNPETRISYSFEAGKDGSIILLP